MVPVTAVFNNQGTRVVYVVGAGAAEMRVVELGESNDRMAEVDGGLREGERVALTLPAAGGTTPGFGPRNALQPR
jgi:multidrug efflux pump subunit AcrA (membrane-fusion protein)